MTFGYLWRAALAVIAVVLFFELAIRAFALRRQRGADRVLDADFGWLVKSGSVTRWGWEGRGVARYDADGEISTPYSGGPAIPVLGDSHTEALSVGDRANFVSVAEKLLWERGSRVDLRNRGRGNLSIADHIWAVRVLRQRIGPRAFVIQLMTSDFEETLDRNRPNHLVLANRKFDLVHRPPAARPPSPPPWLAMLGIAEDRAVRPNPRIPRPPDSDVEGGMVAAEAALLREALGDVPAIIVWLTYPPYHFPPGDDNVVIPATLRGMGYTVIDMAPPFHELRRRGGDPRSFLNGSAGWGHINTEGHAVIGRLLAGEIERLPR